MGFRRKRREELRIDVTPMVDVVFLLLIFFMISTTFVETPGISIELPQSSAKAVSRQPEEFKVTLAKDGTLFYGEREISIENLALLIQAQSANLEDTTFYLLADKDTPHGVVVNVMDIARKAGFGRMAIGTENRGGEP